MQILSRIGTYSGTVVVSQCRHCLNTTSGLPEAVQEYFLDHTCSTSDIHFSRLVGNEV